MIETKQGVVEALNEVVDYIRSTYNKGYEAGQADLLHSLKAYFPDMTCVADISLRIEALQDEVKRGTLDAVRPTMASHFREATERCKSHAGVTMPSFRCVRCKCTKLIKGRKTVVKGTGKFGYHCASCVEELENPTPGGSR